MEKFCVKGYLKRSGKRVLSILLCACMIGTMIPITARAETEGTSMPSNGEVICTCANLCTEDKVNSDCPVCGAEEADLSKCTGKVQSENNENQLNTGESEEAKNETELTITAWEWIDEEELINPETGILALPFANEETPAFFDDVVALLPTQILATVETGEDIEAKAASETITLGDWSCEEYPKEGAYSDSYTFAATLPEGYVLSYEAKAPNVLVELGGAQMYENEQTTGAFTVTGGTLGTDYTYDNNNKVLTINTGTAITIKNTDPSTPTNDRIEVAENVSANITLAGVNIDVSASEYIAAFKIADDSHENVTITLADDSVNMLKSGDKCAGLQKNGGEADIGKLTIQGGTGKLIAEGGGSSAGIGGGNQGTGSNIEISGGTVSATGTAGGAGIGGGKGYSGSIITISGGTVTAIGTDGGAGIGGGYDGTGYDITISGGIVTATGSTGGAGIGGGEYREGYNITISGGTVTATGGMYGAGIGGGGVRGSGSDITINGGSVKATGANSIGGGQNCDAVTPTNDGTTPVYPITIENPDSKEVLIDGVSYTPVNHKSVDGNDTNLYAYLTGEPHLVKVGEKTCFYVFNSESKAFIAIPFIINSTNGGALTYGTDYDYADGALTIKSDKAVTIKNVDPNTPTTDRIEVADGVSANITLAGVNINVSDMGETAAFKIADDSTGNVTITLANGTENTLKSGTNCAGLQKNGGEETGTLIIQGGSNGTGNLTAIGGSGGYGAAGIGGGSRGSGSNITISGGTVTANGKGEGAGIGGGPGGTGSNIIIKRGTVTATGVEGAGIGGGINGSGSNITISGGTVTATGVGGAGIGGGNGGEGSNITISGGTVTATGVGGAGIGGGSRGYGSNITISGGNVTATSEYGAGIGGNGREGSNITMDGDAVLYTSSINGDYSFNKGVVYDGVTVSGDAGSYTLAGGVGTVYGNPNVSGFTKPTGSILGTNLADTGCINVTVSDVDYTGAVAAPTATVTVNKTALSKTLVQGTDYTVSVSSDNKTDVGEKQATIVAVTGSGNVGENTGHAFNVKTVALFADKIEMSLSGIQDGGYVYNINAIEPVPVVTLKRADGSEYTLIKDTDYTVDYSNNTDAYELLSGDDGYEPGKAPTVMVTAKDNGNFTGSRSMNFKIHPADMPGFTITPYSGSYDGVGHSVVSITPEEEFSGYTVYYSTDNKETWSTTVPTITDAGTKDFYVKATKKNYKDWISEKQTATVTPVALTDNMISFNDANHYYTGQEVKPGITVNDGHRNLVSGTDYTVSYTNNTSVSTESSKAKVTITATNGNYTGTVSADFSIEYANEEYMNYCTVSDTEGNDGWYSSDVTIQNKAETNSAWGALQFSDSPTGTFADSYTVSAEGITNATIWFKQTITGYIGSDSTTVKIDKTAPVWTENGCGISVKENWWKSLLNTISFGLFYKETVDVKVCASDSLSGVAAYYYYIDSTSGTVKTAEELDALSFTQYMGSVSGQNPSVKVTSLAPDGNYIVYAYAVDAVGNRSAYVCSEGVVVDSTAPTISNIVAPSKEASTLTDTTAQISFTGSEVGTCFYMVKESGETAPASITEFAEEKAQPDEKGMSVWTAKDGISYATMKADGSNTVTLTGLNAYTEYTLYLAAVDQAGNSTGTTVYSQSFETCKTIPTVADADMPKISGTYGQTVENMTLTPGTAKVGSTVITGIWAITDSNKANVPGVGTTATYQVTFTPDASYNDIYDTVSVPVKPTVSKKAIIVTADDKTKTYGQDNPELTYTVPEGTLVGTDTEEALGITLSCVANENSPVKEGGYAITGTSNSANYQVTVNPGVLTITKATPVITATTGYTKTYGDIKFFLDATDNSAEASLQYAVTESKNPSGTVVEKDAIVTVDARGYVTITGTGTAKVTASLQETANYNAASKDITIMVNKADNAPNMPGTSINASNRCNTVGDVPLPSGWVWQESYRDNELTTTVSGPEGIPVEIPVSATAEYIGADKTNYINTTVTVSITRSACDHIAGDILYTDTGNGEKAPTCTEDGKGHIECRICTETIEYGIVVKAAHKFSSAWTIDVPATTTSEGSKSHHCSVCGEKNDVTVIPKLVISGGGDSGNAGDSSDNDGDNNDSGNTGIITDLGIGNITKPTIKPIVIPGSFTQEINLSPGIGNNIKPATNTEDNIEEPFIKGENGKEGWDVIRDEVNQVKDGDTVTVDMNGAAVVPSDVLSEIKGKDITIVFDMGNGITWSVNGQSITGDAIGDIDFSVTTNTNSIPVDIINNITGERYSKQISLSYDGEFGFTAVLSINMEAANAGLFANLFYYNENTGEMEFICYDEIAADGTADLTFTHASDYAIVIDTEPMDSVSDGEVLNGETDSDEEISTIENDKKDTQDVTEADSKTWNPWWVIIICIVVIVITLGAFIVIRKRNQKI